METWNPQDGDGEEMGERLMAASHLERNRAANHLNKEIEGD